MLFADPIYESIVVNEIEREIIDTPFFQRLRWVSQLSGTFLLYPSATHNRFSHSLGVMFLSGEYAKHLFPGDTQTLQIVRLAGLLHDIAHGPFSHVYDFSVYQKIYKIGDKGHDLHRFKILKELEGIITKYGYTIEQIAKVWQPQEKQDQILSDIIQGYLGADRMDYLARDNYFTGSKLTAFSWKRFIYFSQIVDGKLSYPQKLQQEINLFLICRKEMYYKVYQHKTSLKAGEIIKEMMNLACDDLRLVERTENMKEFVYINEYLLLGEIMALPETHPSKKLLYCLLSRDFSDNEKREEITLRDISVEKEIKEINLFKEI